MLECAGPSTRPGRWAVAPWPLRVRAGSIIRSLRASGALLLVLLVIAGGCGPQPDGTLPDPAAAAQLYGDHVDAEVRGNLLELRIPIAEELFRGGPIWARSGPYFYLFSPPTRDLFADFGGLAAIRVVTLTPGGEEVARAELRRDALTEPRWREALYRSAIAQRDGTERPRALEELTNFGEDHTEFHYNPEYVGR
jgi:hypothetical protein